MAIDSLEKDWVKYPVLHIDLSGKAYQTPEDLDVTLDQHLRKVEAEYGIQPKYTQPDARFKDAIEAAYEKTGRPVAILINRKAQCFQQPEQPQGYFNAAAICRYLWYKRK